ncbi:hypothetical protein L6164_016812 [Bauhinia variegata]|uniref:Uncharacterized protein n=1 Tax=Bauhinia variegata TaxID=167791 RepID=A0ACB9N5R7_BAUVA|nr:hypothetical protein L6164_016812 [Bauhinia variegata]
MASFHPLLSISSTKQPQNFPHKISNSQRTTFMPKHGYGCFKNKISFTIVSKQNIHLSETREKYRQEDILVRHAEALKEVKHVLLNTEMENAIEGLSMIDYIQQLGIQYIFEEEIEAILKRQQLMFRSQVYCGNDDLELSEVALKFRLLRQEGYWVHENVFDHFTDNEGKLKEKFWGNIEGLIGLFEASQFSIEGESRLDEAGKLSHQLLNAWKSRFHDKPQAKAIANTLQYPIHKCLPKLMPTKLQLPTFGWTNSLEELSKLDAEINSTLQSEEILQVST